MGKGRASMNDQYDIVIQRPAHPRRGDLKLIVAVTDSQNKEIFRDRAELNSEKTRKKMAQRISNHTGDPAEDIADRLLDKLGQLPQPMPPASAEAASGGSIGSISLRGHSRRANLEQGNRRRNSNRPVEHLYGDYQ